MNYHSIITVVKPKNCQYLHTVRVHRYTPNRKMNLFSPYSRVEHDKSKWKNLLLLFDDMFSLVKQNKLISSLLNHTQDNWALYKLITHTQDNSELKDEFVFNLIKKRTKEVKVKESITVVQKPFSLWKNNQFASHSIILKTTEHFASLIHTIRITD